MQPGPKRGPGAAMGGSGGKGAAGRPRGRRSGKRPRATARRKRRASRNAKREAKRAAREKKARIRSARRRARMLAAFLFVQGSARRLGRLVWPAYTRRMPRGKAVLVFALNLFPPGLGTVVYGKWERGLAQFLLAFVIVGWVWSILDGVRILIRAFAPDRNDAAPGAQARPRRG